MRSFSRGLRFAPDGGGGGIDVGCDGRRRGDQREAAEAAGSSLRGARCSVSHGPVSRDPAAAAPTAVRENTAGLTDRGKSRRVGIVGYERGPPLTHLMPTWMMGLRFFSDGLNEKCLQRKCRYSSSKISSKFRYELELVQEVNMWVKRLLRGARAPKSPSPSGRMARSHSVTARTTFGVRNFDQKLRCQLQLPDRATALSDAHISLRNLSPS